MNIISPALTDQLILDASVAEATSSRANFWKYREGISESLSMGYRVYKNDIALDARAMPALIEELQTRLQTQDSDLQLAVFGHLGDGNLHLNIYQTEQESRAETFQSRIAELEKLVYAFVQKHRGSISAEHGIGLLKKDHLHYSRSAAEIEFMRQIKAIFDPDNILNPGKIL